METQKAAGQYQMIYRWTSELSSLDTDPSKRTTPPTIVKLSSPQHMSGRHLQDQQVMVNHLDMESDEFKIAVHVPRLGVDRMLDSAKLHGKLNDLLERGLILHDAASTALRQAQQNRIDR